MAAVTSRGRASGVEPLDLAFDPAAVAGLYERNAGRLFGYCLSRLGRREDAEDAVQTTFLHALRALRGGVIPLVEPAWLLGIARNVCLSRREAFGRRKRLEVVCDPHDLESLAPARPLPREELMGLQEALAELPERQRRAVLLRDWRGLPYDEIATELGVSHAAVETLIFRGRRALAERLGEEPSTSRRRLASVGGNLASLLAAVKSWLSGGVVAVKVGAAVVAVSSAGLAAGALETSSGEAARAQPSQAAPARVTPAAGRSSTLPVTPPAAAAPAVRPKAVDPTRKAKPGPARVPHAAPVAATASGGGPAPAAEPNAPVGAAPVAASPGQSVGEKVDGVVKKPAAALPVPTEPPPAVGALPAVPTLPPPSLPAPVSAPAPPLPAPVPVPPVPVPPAPALPVPPVAAAPPATPPAPALPLDPPLTQPPLP